MYFFGFFIAFFITLSFILWVYVGWRNNKSRGHGSLPPGSNGFPIIGETLQLIVPSYSLDLPSFIRTRIQRHGPVFRTRLVGRPVVMSADPELNRYIVQQEGKMVEMWYLDTFSKLFALEGEGRTNAAGYMHKYLRNITLSHFGAERLRAKLVPLIEDSVHDTLSTWSTRGSVDVKSAALTVVIKLAAKQLFGYDSNKAKVKLEEKFTHLSQGILAFPLYFPGTTYYKCLKNKDEVMKMMKEIVKERIGSPEATHRGDFLDHALQDLNKEKFLSEEFIVQVMFGLLFASSESTSISLTLILKFLSENPHVLDELTAEHEKFLKNRENPDAPFSWSEVKSMTFTLYVINESLRLGNVSLGLLRKALKDIQFKGYTIPAGWTIMVLTSACQYNDTVYKDPLVFNPWRWKDLESDVVSRNFMPFGGGTRQCAGAEFAKTFLATFLHVLVSKYKWYKIKGGEIARNPILGFPNGLHIKVAPKDK